MLHPLAGGGSAEPVAGGFRKVDTNGNDEGLEGVRKALQEKVSITSASPDELSMGQEALFFSCLVVRGMPNCP